MSIDVTIRKQKIKVVTTSEQYALQIRKRLNDQLQYDLIAILESLFSGSFSSDEYITIDKLKIDLGTVTPDVFEQHFVELIAPKLKSELQKLAEAHESTFLQQEQLLDDHVNTSISSNSKQGQEIRALLYFLMHGIYPWWYKKEQQQTPEALLANLSKEAIDTLLLNILSLKNYRSIEEAAKVTDRLFIHLPPAQNERLIYQLLNLYNSASLTNNIDALIKNKQDLIQSFSITAKEFYKSIFQLIIDENTAEDQHVIEHFIKWLNNNQKKSPDEASGIINSSTLKEALKNDADVNKKKKQASSETEQEGIYISNAGLILVCPFLPSFFKEVSLLNTQNQFISVAAQQKAAVLLYYLQCNSESYNEWEMAFNKIICGIPVEEILAAEITIAEKEKEECNALLQSIVDYWDALRGASTEAVQNTFILREGKISHKEDHWLLQVERTGVDILLERLPWSYSTIRLPWLNHLIYTEW